MPPVTDVAASDTPSALAQLVGDVSTFVDEYWEQKVLLRRHAIAAERLFTMADADQLLTTSALRCPSTCRVVKQGEVIDPGSYSTPVVLDGMTSAQVEPVVDPDRVLRLFAGGATVVLQGLQRYWPPLTQFCRSLDRELTHPTHAGAYLTPPASQGLGAHFDGHDVFLVQVHGRKQWAIHDPFVAHPVEGAQTGLSSLGTPAQQIELAPGDCLYLPRGAPHSARSEDEASLHLTIGVQSHVWLDVFSAVLQQAKSQVDFRAALPPGFANDVTGFADEIARHLESLRQWLDAIEVKRLASDLANSFWSERAASLDGQLSQLLRLGELDDTSEIRRRGGANIRLIHADRDSVALVQGTHELRFPIEHASMLELIVESEGLTVADLAPFAAEDVRLALARQLVREGFVEVVGEP